MCVLQALQLNPEFNMIQRESVVSRERRTLCFLVLCKQTESTSSSWGVGGAHDRLQQAVVRPLLI